MIQVQAGAGGTESMDWASMVMDMYKSWAQRRGFAVTVIEEMPGEIAGIKVHFLNSQPNLFYVLLYLFELKMICFSTSVKRKLKVNLMCCHRMLGSVWIDYPT